VRFPRRLLDEREDVVLDLHPHWWYFARPFALLVAALAGLVALAVASVAEWGQLALGVVALGALLWFLARYARWATTNFVLTTDRLIHRTGVLAKRGIEIPLERVNTVFSGQTVLERLLRSGDLVIESGGERGRQVFADIPRPAEVQNEIHRQMEGNEARMSGGSGGTGGSAVAAAPRPGLTVVEQLEKLAELRERGVLTDDEFTAKKADLLERM
jgi:membrane protein YdbS with pleckstrin-like domain